MYEFIFSEGINFVWESLHKVKYELLTELNFVG